MLSQSSKSISEKDEEYSGKQEYKKEIQNLREGKQIILIINFSKTGLKNLFLELIKQKEELKKYKEIIQNLSKKCNETR